MFLDEFASGLDSGATLDTTHSLRELSDSGQALLVTTLQLSSVLFELLKRAYTLEV